MTNPGQQQNLRDTTEGAAKARQAVELGQPRPQFYAYRRYSTRTGTGLVGRLVGLAVTLVGITIAVGILLFVLNRTNPGVLYDIGQWFAHLF